MRQLVLDIEWAAEDALPFALCISSIGPAPACSLITDVSVARGNVLLVDHGCSVDDELGKVPTRAVSSECGDGCLPPETRKTPGRFRPTLPRPELTCSEPVPACVLPPPGCGEGSRFTAASTMLHQDPRAALPWISLGSIPPAPNGGRTFSASDLEDPAAPAKAISNAGGEQEWQARRDLLESGPDDRHFVVETDDRGRSHLRFGDGDCGRPPEAGESFRARYRVGNGTYGNVGAETITRIVFRSDFPDGVELRPRNPLPAAGGQDPEPVAEARLRAPHAFRTRIERAVTADDYAAIVKRDFAPRVQQAAAALCWNGVGAQVLVAVDALGRAEADSALLCEIERHLWRYRRIGHDVRVEPAQSVPLDIGLCICVRGGYLRGHVQAALLDAFSNRLLTGGRRGFFHPDSVSFGQGIYLSHVVAAAQAVEGVESVRVTRFERLYEGPDGEIAAGVLRLGPLEIARLDNDPGNPERGRLTLRLEGGR